MTSDPLLSATEAAGILTRMINRAFGVPVADHDDGGNVITFAVPATGQLFTVTVTERAASHAAR